MQISWLCCIVTSVLSQRKKTDAADCLGQTECGVFSKVFLWWVRMLYIFFPCTNWVVHTFLTSYNQDVFVPFFPSTKNKRMVMAGPGRPLCSKSLIFRLYTAHKHANVILYSLHTYTLTFCHTYQSAKLSLFFTIMCSFMRM